MVDSDLPEPLPRRVVSAAGWDVLAVIAVGGAVGSLARWLVAEALPTRPGDLPWATLLVNVTGSLLLGVLVVLVTDVPAPSRWLRPFLGVGVLGGFTTFSTYALETRGLLVDGRAALAAAYVAGSVVAGVVAAGLGVRATRVLLRSRARA